MILASPAPLERVFTNLLSNAIKFSDKGKTVNIVIEETDKTIQIAFQAEGIGIPSEDLPHIGGRFFRASNATKHEIQGSGIGLYIVKNIIEGFDGSFKVTSVEGTGTTITIELPKVGQ